MRLIIEPADGVAPVLAAIKNAKRTIEIAIFRIDRKDVEVALRAAAARGVRVTALIAFANRGGQKRLRKLELRFLEAGVTVARTSDDLIRYHGKYILIDRRELYVLSFNFTRLDIDHSRGFGVVTRQPVLLKEAARLFKTDCTRSKFASKIDSLVVSPANARRVLGAFLKQAKRQLLIYDPNVGDEEMLRILQARAKAGVEVKIIGRAKGKRSLDVRKLAGARLHTRTVIRDRTRAFVGSQSLDTQELDSRREVGLIVQDAATVKKLVRTFDADWSRTSVKHRADPPDATQKEVAKAVKVFRKQLQPLARTVKKAVREAVVKAGDDVLHDKDVKDTMKKVAKQAAKEAVKEAVQEARSAQPDREE